MNWTKASWELIIMDNDLDLDFDMRLEEIGKNNEAKNIQEIPERLLTKWDVIRWLGEK